MLPKGTADNEWHDTVEVLVELADEKSKQNDSEGNEKCRANIVQVLHDQDNEVQGIFFQTESQRKLYPIIGKVLIMDGTHGTNNVDFTLYHLLGEDNNGNSQPIAQYFTKTETKESIGEFLRIFSEVKNKK